MREGWVETKLVDAVEVLDRLRKPINSTEREGRQGSVPYYGANGQAGWIDDSIFNEELVLLGEDAIDFADPNARKAYLISGPSWVNNHAHVLRAKPEKVYSYFLAESLNKVDYSQYVSFGTRSKLTQGSMNGIKILLPPLPEQKRIVDLISSVDSYIDALEQQAESARKSRNAVLHEMLTAVGDDWTEITIENVLNFTIGGIWGAEPDQEEVNVKVVRSTEFRSDGVLFYDSAVDRSIKKSQLTNRRLTPGDILLEKSGGGPSQPVGRVVFVEEDIPDNTVCSNFVQLVRPDASKIVSRFLFLILWQWHFQNRTLEFQAQTTGIRNLRTPDYLAQEIYLPPLAEQKRIVDLISSMDDGISATEKLIDQTKQLRSGLLSGLLSGGHEIPESYDKVIGAA